MRLALLLLSGCYLHHTLEEPTDAGTDAVDAGTPDVGTPDVGSCLAGGFIWVETEGCHLDGSSLFEGAFLEPRGMSVGERLRIDLLNLDGSECVVFVDGLSEPIRDGFIRRLERVADLWLGISGIHIAIHDTSLCDGPEGSECPLAMLASSYFTRAEGLGVSLDVELGDEVCRVRPCGELHLLELTHLDRDAESLITLAQGEISGDAESPWRFANIRSWRTCTDEAIREISWAFWTR